MTQLGVDGPNGKQHQQRQHKRRRPRPAPKADELPARPVLFNGHAQPAGPGDATRYFEIPPVEISPTQRRPACHPESLLHSFEPACGSLPYFAPDLILLNAWRAETG